MVRAALWTAAASVVAITNSVIADPPTDAASRWIAENAIRLRTFEPDDQGFTDLAPLKLVIGDARVVMLGEQAHAEGATFLGKTRLIRFLHEEMGFDVLCFESGLYDCERAWQSLRAGVDPHDAMSTGIFPIWMEAEELDPLAAYLGAEATERRPLELCGYDCQLTGTASRDHIRDDIKALNAKANPPPLEATQLAALDAYLDALMDGTAPADEKRRAGEAAIASLRDALTAERFPEIGERDRSFWRQMLKSLPALSTVLERSQRNDLSLPERFNARDEQGGDTMIWLARERYRDRKIIVWAASMHCVRSPEGIVPVAGTPDYSGVHTMGQVAAAALGSEVFVLSFVSGPGTAGNVFGKSWDVPEAPAGSLEAMCSALKLGPSIIPVCRVAEDSFGGSAFIARPLGNSPMRATWQRHVDAFAFTPVMKPATRRMTKEEIERYKDLLPALDLSAKSANERCAAEHKFADKGDFNAIWDGWMRAKKPTKDELDGARASVAEWSASHRDDPCVGWRALVLEAHVAERDGKQAKAIELLDRALAAFPARRHSDPRRQSGYHHIANQRALLTLKSSGVEAAMAWIVARIESDPKMRAFFAMPLLETLETTVQREELQSRVRSAFEKRAAQFPDDLENCRAAQQWAERMLEEERAR